MAFWKPKKPAEQPVQMPVPAADLEQMTPAPEPPADDPKPGALRRRSETMKLRLTPEELAYLTDQAKAAGMSRTDYIMAAVEGSPVIVIDEVPKLIMELRRQGANLNQMVRLAHQTHSVDLPELRVAVQRCAAAQAEIVRMCDHWNMKLRKESEKKGE